MKIDCRGITLSESSSNNFIFGNDISVYIEGIGTRWDSNCNHNVISENNILKNKIGIRLNKNCNHNVISENNIYNNTIGSEFFNCSYNEIINNTIENNTKRGIKLSDAHHNTISGNKILENGDGTSFNCGIRIVGEKASNNYISDNDVSNNSPIGIFILDAYDNVITNNNLIENNCEGSPRERGWGNAYFICNFKLGKLFNLNSWDNNYWSDYIGLRIFPKIILGDIKVSLILFQIPWFDFDWNPASEPYDI
jgi:parallel beta-helix repeat protein